jgi:hypothetical protein
MGSPRRQLIFTCGQYHVPHLSQLLVAKRDAYVSKFDSSVFKREPYSGNCTRPRASRLILQSPDSQPTDTSSEGQCVLRPSQQFPSRSHLRGEDIHIDPFLYQKQRLSDADFENSIKRAGTFSRLGQERRNAEEPRLRCSVLKSWLSRPRSIQ